MWKIYSSLITFIILAVSSFAQPEHITSMKVFQQDDQLVIEYELKKHALKNYYYEVELSLSYEAGKIKPTRRFVKGIFNDWKKQRLEAGKNRIVWDILKEPEVNNITGKIEVDLNAKLYATVPGGSDQAMTSLLVPGLGDYRVREKKAPYFLITTAAYGSILSGFIFRGRYNSKFDKYLVSRDAAEISRLKTASNRAYNASNTFFIIGGVIWIADVFLVRRKGLKNKKKYKEYMSDRWQLTMDYQQWANISSIGVKYNF